MQPSFDPTMTNAATNAAAALLEWYRTAGVTAFLSEAPRDRFAETQAEKDSRAARRGMGRASEAQADSGESDTAPGRPMPSRSKSAGVEPRPPSALPRAAVPDEIAIADAREHARSATTLAELQAAIESFEGCNLKVSARSTVFGEGNGTAALMLVGDPPGRDEDTAGAPFVGSQGQLLTRMLDAIGLERDAVRSTHILPWRPPGNRSPTLPEMQICLPFVQRHIELVAPRILVCFGSTARTLLDTKDPITSARGQWTSYIFGLGDGQTIDAMAMLSPSYLLKQQAQKRFAWQDLLAVKARLDEGASGAD